MMNWQWLNKAWSFTAGSAQKWMTTDDMYYRKWMHEIPPLQHIREAQSLICTTIFFLQPTHKCRIRGFQKPRLCVWGTVGSNCPDDLDLVMHSATHLFTESEFHNNGLREICQTWICSFSILHKTQNSPALSITKGNFLRPTDFTGYELGLAHYVFLRSCPALILNTPIPDSRAKTANYFP